MFHRPHPERAPSLALLHLLIQELCTALSNKSKKYMYSKLRVHWMLRKNQQLVFHRHRPPGFVLQKADAA